MNPSFQVARFFLLYPGGHDDRGDLVLLVDRGDLVLQGDPGDLGQRKHIKKVSVSVSEIKQSYII